MLKKDKPSYPNYNKEHTFDSENLKKANKELNDVYKDVAHIVGVERAKKLFGRIEEIIKCFALEADKEVKEYIIQVNRRRKNNGIRWLILIMSCIIIMFGVAWGFEYFQFQTLSDFFGIWESICVELIIFFIGIIVANTEVKQFRNVDETFIEGISSACKEVWYVLRRMSVLHIIMIVWMAFSVGVLWAKNDMFAKVATFVKGGYYALAEEQVEDVVLVHGTTITKEAEVYLLANDAELVKTMEDVYIPNSELVYEEKLSAEDCAKIFFSDGEYKVADWECQEDINQVVLQMVENLLKEKAENIFDKDETQGGAPQEVRNMISYVSEHEGEVESFADLNGILGIRTDAYFLYPKKTLTNLISNDYHKLALLFALNAGNEDTIVYYYGKSIDSNLEYLKFAGNSDESIKDRLKRISQRYTDIVYVCPKHELSKKAEALAKAFKNAEEQY